MSNIVVQWLLATPALIITVALLFLPGLLISYVLRLRGLCAFVVSPGLSVGLISVLAVIFPVLHVPWNLWTFVAATVLLTAISYFIFHRTAVLGSQKFFKAMRRTFAVTLAASVVVIGVQFVAALRLPGTPPQTWDSVFHQAGVRYILQEANASSLSFAGLGGAGFYPAAWHDVVSLVSGFGIDVAVASNCVSFVLMAIIWPLGSVLFTKTVFPKYTYAPLYAGLMSIATLAFPHRVGSYGTLWPLLLGYALIPWLMVVFINIFRAKTLKESLLLIGIVLFSCAGLGMAHPQGLAVLAVFILWYSISELARFFAAHKKEPRHPARRLWLATISSLSSLALLTVIFWQAQVTGVSSWQRRPLGGLWSELLGIFTDSQLPAQGYGNTGKVWIFALFLVVAIGAMIRQRKNRKNLWLLGSWLSFSYLFLAATTMVLPGYQLVGIFYSDAVRVGATVTLAQVPLMALGAAVLADWVQVWLRKLKNLRNFNIPRLAVFITVTVIVIGSFGLNFFPGYNQLRINYKAKDETGLNGLIDANGLELIRRIPQEIDPGSAVIGDPFTGAILIYSLTDASYPIRYFGDTGDEDTSYLRQHFNEIASDPKVCELLKKNDIKYFFTNPVVYTLRSPTESNLYGGLKNVPLWNGYFTLKDSAGKSKLYEITGCK